jgi:Rv2525c-like, glycoside hydrolase-like domain
MRRVAMLAVTIGFTLAGPGGGAVAGPAGAAGRPRAAAEWAPAGHSGPGGCQPPLTRPGRPPAVACGHAGPRHAGPRHAGRSQARTVRFGGYLIDVPAGWPVYWLSRDPSQCVRYDRNAVYLGTPGTDQLCPAHLAGRVDTISVRQAGCPAPPGPGVPGGANWQPVSAPMDAAGLRQAGAAARQNAQEHQLLVTAAHPGLTISATYASGPGLVDRIIASTRPADGPGRQPARPGGPGSPPAGPGPAAPGPASSAPGGTGAAAGRAGSPPAVPGTGSPPAAPGAGSPPAAPGAPGLGSGGRRAAVRRGFDTCAAPSLRALRAWRRAFSAVAIYIGGPEAACGWGNLSPSWVRAARAMGWALIPAYVGRQASCDRFRVRIHLAHAKAEGQAAAREAISLAAALGIGRHAPLYDDMEAYPPWHRCRSGVLSFLDGWTRALHAHGYRSGVYSSAGSAVVDLARANSVYGRPLAKPDSIWFGLWDGVRNLNGLPYLRASQWPAGHRIKQWLGGHRRRIGGITLDIDSDLAAGAVYGLAVCGSAVPLLARAPGAAR